MLKYFHLDTQKNKRPETSLLRGVFVITKQGLQQTLAC